MVVVVEPVGGVGGGVLMEIGFRWRLVVVVVFGVDISGEDSKIGVFWWVW